MNSDSGGLFVAFVFALLTALVASNRGRSAVAWFVIGFFFPCFALVLVLVLPDLKAQQERERRLQEENRRLRERLQKDRQVADHRHEETSRRLSVHDRALAIDTAPGGPAAELAGGPTPPALPPEEAVERWRAHEWHYVEEGRAVGPVPWTDLRRMWREGAVGGSTLVWTEALEDWRALRDVPALEEGLRG